MRGGVIATFLLALIIVSSFEMPFQYNCFVSRIPIFLFGIYVYNKISSNNDNKLNLFRWGYVTSILGIVVFIYANIAKPELLFISTTLLALALIEILLRCYPIYTTTHLELDLLYRKILLGILHSQSVHPWDYWFYNIHADKNRDIYIGKFSFSHSINSGE